MIYPCATDKSLTDLAADRLEEDDAHDMRAHLTECSECADRLRKLCDDSKVRRAFQLCGAATTVELDRPAELQSLRESNIIGVHEFGEIDGHAFIAADYCDGPTLAEWLASRDSAVPCRMAARIVLRLADAIAHAHANGLIHRDVKPANILLDVHQADSELPFSPRLTDFGLAKWVDSDSTPTRRGVLKGTPRYMSPEQARGDRDAIRTASDIYSLGVILYELLTGQAPFRGDSDVDTLRRLVSDLPTPVRRLVPAIPRDLDAITMRCLEKSPADRYQTATALCDDLNRYLAGRPTLARPLNPGQQFVRWARHNPAVAGATILSIMVLSIAAVMLTLKNQELEQLNVQLSDVAHSQAELLYAATDTIDLWDLTSRRKQTTYAGHASSVHALAFSPDGRQLASGSEDRYYVRIWDTQTGRLVQELYGHRAQVRHLAFSADGRRLLSSTSDGLTHVWSLPSGRRLLTLGQPLKGLHPCKAVLSQNGGALARLADGSVEVYDLSGYP